MIPNYPGCENCPLRDRKPVYGGGKTHGMMIIGEAPGQTEAALGRPFVGISGNLLQKTLKAVGIDPKEMWITNAVLCHPQGNKTPSLAALTACRGRLIDEIKAAQPTKILTVGGSSITSLMGAKKSVPITRTRGLGMMVNLDGGSTEVLPWEDTPGIFTVPTYHPAAILRDPDLYRDFYLDILKFKNNTAPLPKPEVEVIVARTGQEAIENLEWFKGASVVSYDLETSGFSPLKDLLFSFGFGVLTPDNSGVSLIIPIELVLEDPGVQRAILSMFTEYDGVLACHNEKFDLQFTQALFQDDFTPRHPADTMLMNYAQDERGTGAGGEGRGYRVHSLKDQARVRYDVPDYHFDFNAFYKRLDVRTRMHKLLGGVVTTTTIREWIKETTKVGRSKNKEKILEEKVEAAFQAVDWANLDNPWNEAWMSMYKYQGLDTYITCRLHEDLTRELNEESPRLLKLVNEILVPGTEAFAQAEMHGTLVDRDYLEKLKGRTLRRLDRLVCMLKGRLIQATYPKGDGPKEIDFNPSSPPQVHAAFKVFGFHPVDGTKDNILVEIKNPGYGRKVKSFVNALIAYRHESKILQTYIVGLLERSSYDGRVRPDLLMHGADTGRIACRDPNLQNIPILMGLDIRNAFIAPDDFVWVEADYSQLELRVAAWYSQDQNMIEVFKTGGDIHRRVASIVFEKPESEITFYERQMGKVLGFGIVYGRGAKGITEGFEAEYLVKNLGYERWTLAQAQGFIDRHLAGMPQLRDWIQAQHRKVKALGYVESPTGRRRRFPLLASSDIAAIERKSANTPIQGFASDINIMALIRLQKVFKRDYPNDVFILYPVHDSIEMEIRKDKLGEVLPIIKAEMEVPPEGFNVPLKVEIKVGRSWGSADKVKDEEMSGYVWKENLPKVD